MPDYMFSLGLLRFPCVGSASLLFLPGITFRPQPVTGECKCVADVPYLRGRVSTSQEQ